MKNLIAVFSLLALVISGVTFASAQIATSINTTSSCSLLTTQLEYKDDDEEPEDETGGQVEVLQRFLVDKKYLVTKNFGYYGPVTKNAVAAFQKANGITQNGRMGPITMAKINEIYCQSGGPTSNGQEVTPVTTGGNQSTSGVISSYDLNRDGKIDSSDVYEYSNYANVPINYYSFVDFNADGAINYKDLAVLRLKASDMQYDVTRDGKIDSSDVFLYANYANVVTGYSAVMDFNSDGTINYKDLAVLRLKASDMQYDVTRDGKIDSSDAAFYTNNSVTGYNSAVDFNSDGSVTAADLALLTSKITSSVTPTEESILTVTGPLLQKIVVNNSKLNMVYGKATEETLSATAKITIVAAGTKVGINKPGYYNSDGGLLNISLFKSNGEWANVSGDNLNAVATGEVIDNGTSWTIPAGKKASFIVTRTFNPKLLFADSYYIAPSLHISSIDQLTGAKSNVVNVFGEESPYISSAVQNSSGTIAISGARLNYEDNYLQVNGSGNTSLAKFTPSATNVVVDLSAYKLTTGTHSLQITNSRTGNSNYYSVQITQSTSTAEASLYLSSTAGMVSTTVSPNSANVKIGSFAAQAVGGSIRVSQMTVETIPSWYSLSNLSNLSIRSNGAVIGYLTTGALTPANVITFPEITITNGQIRIFDIYADIGSAETGAVTTGATINYRGSNGILKSVSAKGVTLSSVGITPGSSIATPTLSSASPVSQFILGGTRNYALATYNLKTETAGASATLRELKFSVSGADAIESVTVGGMTAYVVNGIATITGLYIPISSTGVDIPVFANFSGFQNSTSGGSLQTGMSGVKITLTNVQITGSNGQVITKATSVSSNPMTLVASKPTVVMNNTRGMFRLGAENKIAEFTVTADPNGKIGITSLQLSPTTFGILNPSITAPRLADGTVTINGSTAVMTGSNISVTFPAVYEIGAGQSKTFSVYATIAGSAQSGQTGTISTVFTSRGTFKWKDSVGGGITYTGEQMYQFPTSSYSMSLDPTSSVTPKPTITLSAQPTTVTSGGQSALTWSSTLATRCMWSNADAQFRNYENTTSGTNRYTTGITTATTYTLTCVGSGGTTTESIRIELNQPAKPITTLSASPLSLGQHSLTWSSENTKSCTMTTVSSNDGVAVTGQVVVNGSMVLPFQDAMRTVNFACVGNDNSTASSTIAVYGYNFQNTALFVLNMAVRPSTWDMKYDINKDGSISSNDASIYQAMTYIPSVLLNKDKAVLAGRMSVKTAPMDLSYDLTGDGIVNSADSTAFLRLDVVATPKPITTLSASPLSLGQHSLTWSSENTKSCTMTTVSSNDGVAVTGQVVVNGSMVLPFQDAMRTVNFACVGNDNSTASSTVIVYGYNFKNTAEYALKMGVGSVPRDLSYDINKDGTVNSADSVVYQGMTYIPSVLRNSDKAVLAQRMGVKTAPVDISYDLTGDGIVNSADALAFLRLDVVASAPTCTLSTDKSSYNFGETIYATYSTSNASYATWVPDMSGKNNITVTADKLNTSGTGKFIADVVGSPSLTLQAVAADARTVDCTKTFSVAAPPVTARSAAISAAPQAFGYGVYQANTTSYTTSGTRFSSRTPMESSITITLPTAANGKVLVLTAYNPINWVIQNPNNVSVTKVIALGYYAQRVTGLPGVEIESHSYKTDGIYAYAYNNSDENFNKLVSYLAGKGVTLTPANFQGVYATDQFSLGSTGTVLGASAICTNLTFNIHRGNESPSTKKLQQFLIDAGYMEGEVTGFYGDKTVSAIKDYQSAKGLPITGMVYDATRAAIKAETCGY